MPKFYPRNTCWTCGNFAKSGFECGECVAKRHARQRTAMLPYRNLTYWRGYWNETTSRLARYLKRDLDSSDVLLLLKQWKNFRKSGDPAPEPMVLALRVQLLIIADNDIL